MAKKTDQVRKFMLSHTYDWLHIEDYFLKFSRGLDTRREPKYEFNRLKHFRMNKEESEAYEKKIKESPMVNRYLMLAKEESCYFVIPKYMYDYLSELEKEQ